MHNWKPHDINDPFKMRQGEQLVDLRKYVEILNKNNIKFTKEQYEKAKSSLK